MSTQTHVKRCRCRSKCLIKTLLVLLCLLGLAGAHGAAAARTAAAGAAAAAKQAAAAAAAAAEAAAIEPAAAAGSESPEFAWFEQHVASKCFAPPDATWQLDDSSKETVLHRQTQFFGVYDQPEGFYYHYSTTTKQTEFSLVGGARIQAAKVGFSAGAHMHGQHDTAHCRTKMISRVHCSNRHPLFTSGIRLRCLVYYCPSYEVSTAVVCTQTTKAVMGLSVASDVVCVACGHSSCRLANTYTFKVAGA